MVSKSIEMSRKKIVAGNWKMNLDYNQGIKLARSVRAGAQASSNKLVILGTPAIHLKGVSDLLSDHKYMYSAAQNCHQEESGAYTGETSTEMIASVGADYVILGHSERREIFGENNELIKQKVDKALSAGLKVIFCCGEPLEVRKANTQDSYVASQIQDSLFHLSAEQMANVVVAYEPIWAIGTGETASPAQAQEMHKQIRSLISEHYDADVAEALSILYGGSVKPANATELFSQPDVDGGLVGGASLKPEDFCSIISAM